MFAYFLLSLSLLAGGAVYDVTPKTLGLIAEHGAQNVYLLQGGVYNSICLAKRFVGTEQNPTIIREAKPGTVFIRAKAPYLCGIYSADDMPPEWLVIEGLDVSGASVDGIRFIGAKHVTIRNCEVHHNANNGIAAHHNTDLLVENCRIHSNGDLANPTQKHGLYASGERLTIRQNVLFHNTGFGITLWAKAWGCMVADNVCYANNGGAGIGTQTEERDSSPLRPEHGNLIARNRSFENKVGLALSRSSYDRVIDNEAWGNTEASLSFYYASLGPVLLSGNKLDVPFVGGNGKQMVSTQPGEEA